MQKVKWIGKRGYAAPFANHAKVLPICIKANALACNVPARDLFVSPGHAICIDGVLIHAARLVNGVSIFQLSSVEQVMYYHIELEGHEVVFAENCPAETYMGEYFRRQFHNAAEFAQLYPGEAAPEAICLPRLDSGFQLHAIQSRIARRAGIAEATELGGLQGYIDEFTPFSVSGWARNAGAPEAPVCLDISSDGRRVGRVVANIFRQDVCDAGFGSGFHGFEFTFPSEAGGVIMVARAIDGAFLPMANVARAKAA